MSELASDGDGSRSAGRASAAPFRFGSVKKRSRTPGARGLGRIEVEVEVAGEGRRAPGPRAHLVGRRDDRIRQGAPDGRPDDRLGTVGARSSAGRAGRDDVDAGVPDQIDVCQSFSRGEPARSCGPLVDIAPSASGDERSRASMINRKKTPPYGTWRRGRTSSRRERSSVRGRPGTRRSDDTPSRVRPADVPHQHPAVLPTRASMPR